MTGSSSINATPAVVMSQDQEDPYDLNRFIEAQDTNYDDAIAEIRAGRKRSHWMWYVFPQLTGLGQSAMSYRYGIRGEEEARAYLSHPVLGRRLHDCAEAILAVQARSAREILGTPDDLKLKSSATLFARVSSPGSIFEQILDRYYSSERDAKTIELLTPH